MIIFSWPYIGLQHLFTKLPLFSLPLFAVSYDSPLLIVLMMEYHVQQIYFCLTLYQLVIIKKSGLLFNPS